MPSYPEDLALYKKDGVCWFGSVAHEKMAFFVDPEISAEEIKSRFPNYDIEEFEQ